MIVILNAPHGYTDITFSSQEFPTPRIGESVVLKHKHLDLSFKYRVDEVVYNYNKNSIDVYFEN
jgi:hypothetical protein